MKTENLEVDFDLLTEGQLKAVAFLQFNNNDYFIIDANGIYPSMIFDISEKDAKARYKKYKKELKAPKKILEFEEWARIEFTEVDEIIEKEYLGHLVLTDSEADDMCEEYLDQYIDDCIIPELPEHAKDYFDRDSWKEDAKMDGRGHCLASYDGEESKETINGETFYIYRVN